MSRFGIRRVLERLAEKPYPPRPRDLGAMAALWSYLQEHRAQYNTFEDQVSGSFWFRDTDSLALCPAVGWEELFPVGEITVMGSGGDDLSRDDSLFLSGYIPLADPDWLEMLSRTRKETVQTLEEERLARSRDLLALLQKTLQRRTGLRTAIEAASTAIFSSSQRDHAGIKLAYIVARADVRAPDSFRYLCDDKQWRPVTEGLLEDVDSVLDVLPKSLAATRLLSTKYRQAREPRDRSVWERWVGSSNSRLRRFLLPEYKSEWVWYRNNVEDFVRARGGTPPGSYPRVRNNFEIVDYDFPDTLWHGCEEQASSNPAIWASLVRGIARDWDDECKKRAEAKVKQTGNHYSDWVPHGWTPAAWLHRLRNLACLPDQHGQMHLPATLYRTTAETRHLEGIEPFLHSSLDKPEHRELLDLLGVRSKPATVETILARITSLSKLEAPPQEAVWALYNALDRTFPYLPPDKQSTVCEAFAAERLIFCDPGTWETAHFAFLSNPDKIPDIPLVPQQVAHLGLWKLLKLPSEPSIDQIVAWTMHLPANEQLSDTDIRRLRRVLARASERVWRETGHWLDAAGYWSAVSTLRWREADEKSLHGFFHTIKRTVADVSMIPMELLDYDPFRSIPTLRSGLRSQIQVDESAATPSKSEWIVSLANCLMRVAPSPTLGDDPEQENRAAWRAQAERLSQTIEYLVPTLKVAPYLDGAPAGTPSRPKACWHETSLYVRGSGGRTSRELADEVAAAFEPREVKRAISDCVERDGRWIEEYFDANFALKADAALVTAGQNHAKHSVELNAITLGRANGSGAELSNGSQTATCDGVEGNSGQRDDGVEPKKHRDVKDSKGGRSGDDRDNLIERYLQHLGFQYAGEGSYVNDQGHRLHYDRALHLWIEHDTDGAWLGSYFFAEGSLDRGIELPFDSWTLLREPARGGGLVVFRADGTVTELRTQELDELLDTEQLFMHMTACKILTRKPQL